MRPFGQERIDNYTRLFSLFEKQIKSYDKAFDKIPFKINYIIQLDRYKSVKNIKLVLVLLDKPLKKLISYKLAHLKSILENYCRYFSITDITIVRPLNLVNHSNEVLITQNLRQPLDERISIDLISIDSRWSLKF